MKRLALLLTMCMALFAGVTTSTTATAATTDIAAAVYDGDGGGSQCQSASDQGSIEFRYMWGHLALFSCQYTPYIGWDMVFIYWIY